MNRLWRSSLSVRKQANIRASFQLGHGVRYLLSRTGKKNESTSSLIPFGWGRSKKNQDEESLESTKKIEGVKAVVKVEEKRLEKFIPVPRRTLLKELMNEEGLLSWKERGLMERFAAAMDAHYSQRFYAILEEAKLLYDYMDPDKDTYQTRDLSKKELLDNEYWLLQKVDKFLEKANYFEIPKHQLAGLLHDRDTDGLIVSVDPSDYELLRIWTRGNAVERRSRLQRLKLSLKSYFSRKTPPISYNNNLEYSVYTRVFVAVRSRGENKLLLKVFKEVQCNKLEYLLPDGKIKMSNFDKGFIATSVLLGGGTVAMRSLPMIADLVKVQWSWLGVGLAGVLAVRAWVGYKNKRNHYLANLATTLYYKTVANNRGVLTLLADRAQDEEFKEALLAYVFLLSPRNRRGVPGTSHTAEPPIYDSKESLKARIEEWLSGRFDLKGIGFDIEDALEKLDNLGLLVKRKDGRLSVLSIEDCLEVLPESRYRWDTVGAMRDSENSDEQISVVEASPQHGWR